MERRKFIQNSGLAAGALLFSPAFACSKNTNWERFLVTEVKPPQVTFPPEKRVPLGWKAFPVALNQPATIISFSKSVKTKNKIWLRITAAIDFRESKKIVASLAESGTELGVFDMHFAHPFQPFQIEIDSKYIKQIAREGIALTLTNGEKDAWFFTNDSTRTDALGLMPQILVDGDFNPEKAVVENLLSMNSFSPFGWMGGCVQDALFEMALSGNKEAEKVLLEQLNSYLDDDKGIVFENPHTIPIDGRFNSIEDFLPFAGIVNYYPNHRAVQMAVDYILSKEQLNGLITTGHTTTEGCYTLAYPLAAIAVARNNRTLTEKSLLQLNLRSQLLSDKKAIYQRAGENGPEGYANWGRGTVWYLLGLVKTLHILKNSSFSNLPGIQTMEDEFKRAAAFVARWQNEDGLWYSFLDKPTTKIDTTASSGLAAAFAWGNKMGFLDESYKTRAQKAYQALLGYITSDGFLTHVSQINRGGEELQANGYRVISQFALGLMAQLKFVHED